MKTADLEPEDRTHDIDVSADELARLGLAVLRAVSEQSQCAVLFRTRKSERHMLVAKPAAKAGEAIVTHLSLDSGLSALTAADLTDLFSLSMAEAEVALLVSRGAALAAVAAKRGVGLETVRSQFKSTIRKVGVANQKELATVLTQVGSALAASTSANHGQ